jgi:hypothetical protein
MLRDNEGKSLPWTLTLLTQGSTHPTDLVLLEELLINRGAYLDLCQGAVDGEPVENAV